MEEAIRRIEEEIEKLKKQKDKLDYLKPSDALLIAAYRLEINGLQRAIEIIKETKGEK